MRLQRADRIAVAATLLLIPVAFFEIVFLGNTISTSAGQRSINGTRPPSGYVQPVKRDTYRLDPGASAWQSEPWAETIHRQLQQKRAPLWNPHQATGMPLAANLQSAALDPLFAPITTHPTPAMWDAVLLATMVLGALGMYAACRVLGLHPAGALAGAAAFSLSGYFLLYSNNLVFRPYMMLPVLTLLVERTVTRRSWLAAALLAFAIAETLAMGFAPASAVVLGSVAAFAAIRIVRARGARGAVTFRLAAAGAAGLALAAPLLVLATRYIPLAETLHVPGSRLGHAALPAKSAAGWIVPLFNGRPRAPIIGGTVSGTRDWVGGAALFLALIPLAVPRARRVGHPVFFLVLSAGILLKIYGFPLLSWVGDLPVADRIQWPDYGPPVAGFGLAIACAAGVHSIAQRTVQTRRLLWVWSVAVMVAVGLLAANHPSIRAETLFVGKQVALAALAALIVAAAVFVVRARAAWIATAAVLLELVLLVPRGIYNARYDPFTPPSWLAPVAAGLAATPGARTFALDGVAFPNTPQGLGLYDIRSIDALQPKRFAAYIRAFIEPEMGKRFGGIPYRQAGQAREVTPALIEGNPMYDLLGVRWLLTPAGRTPPESARYQMVASGDGVDVYEDLERTPRAFVVGAAERVGSQDEALALFKARSVPRADGTLVVKDLDPRETAVVEAPATALGIPGAAARASGSASITRYLADEVVIQVQSDAPGLLVLTDTYFPGWRATVNGADASVYPADVLFRAIPVPAGSSTVELRYRPPGFRASILIAMLAALACIAVAVGGRARRRRARA